MSGRERGAVVLLVGPDGVGKSTLAHELVARLASEGDVLRLHHRPHVLPARRRTASASEPNSGRLYGRTASVAKFLYLFADFALGWHLRVAPRTRSGAVVVLERGWADMEVDAARYRLRVPAGLIRFGTRILPRADIALVLGAPADVVRARKQELDVDEIKRQLAAWKSVAPRAARRVAFLDATRAPAVLAAEAVAAIASGSSRGLAARVVGGAGGSFRLVPAAGATYFLASGRPARGPFRAGIYRPATARGRLAATALEVVAMVTANRPGARAALADGLAPAIAEALGVSDVTVYARSTPKAAGERIVASVWRERHLLAYAKASAAGTTGLASEFRTLTALAEAELRYVRTPSPLAFLELDGIDLLLASPVRAAGSPGRAFGPAELRALEELARAAGRLAPSQGFLVHGDFTGWNCGADRDSLVVWDWEESGAGHPLDDVFHWELQQAVHFGRSSAIKLVHLATIANARVDAVCAAAGLDPAGAPSALEAFLTRGLADPRLQAKREPALELRAEALELLRGAA